MKNHVRSPQTESLRLKRQAESLIPSYTQTFSKGPSQFVQGVAPVYLDRGKGSHVWDVDGNEYIDYILSLGPIILGHNYPAVSAAAKAQIDEGSILSLPHRLELEVAEILVDLIPCAEMVRYAKNGSDVTAGAVRVARAYTGREVIACCGYHGWQDWYVGTTTRNKGVPQAVQDLTMPFEFNDIEGLKRIFAERPGNVAAVILEPVQTFAPQDGFLEQVRDLATKEGAVLIFDEVITGFRLGLGGAQEYLGVTPDLACFGKAIANGYPLSAVVGRREIMELFDEVFFSFTFGGELVSLAAAKATLEVMQKEDVIGHLWRQGQHIQKAYNATAESVGLAPYTQCDGLAPRTMASFKGSDESESLLFKSLFQQEAIKGGILTAAYHNICYSHSDEDTQRTVEAHDNALRFLAMAIDSGDPARYLEGEPVKPVFRKV
jgi:glutamate-1-semialdehyde aminotransferase